jgi:hypothetical protein
MKKQLKESYQNMHLLSRQERLELIRDLEKYRPDFLKDFTPKWWWWGPCVVDVLLVCDGSLNFGPGGFGLSEFITTFNKLQQQSWLNVTYRVTLAHRSASPVGTDPMHSSPNPVIVNRITGFSFDTSVTLNNFDEVWLFGINTGASLSAAEVNKITAYMNGGGGLFATGDHGALGSALCSQIPRVQDMRLWANTSALNDVNEVSMSGRRRNDTNRPAAGQSISNNFNNQSDNIPQKIAVRTFGGGMPHPLLSISTSLRPSGIIDIMPDHPHEGECAHEKVFTVTNPVTGNQQNVSSQIIATSFVLGGSFAAGKAATDPHCFPSISVFDGRVANIGRIVVDSTWHHFVNINLNGSGSGLSGLNNSDFDVVQRYYMNISNWITRRRKKICWLRWVWADLLKRSQLIEASLNEPEKPVRDISPADLYSIGVLAREILSESFTPALAHELLTEMIEPALPELAAQLDYWKPVSKEKKDSKNKEGYYQEWINYDLVLGTAVGAGFIALRDNMNFDSEKMTEKAFEKIYDVFTEGAWYGIEVSVGDLAKYYSAATKSVLSMKKK